MSSHNRKKRPPGARSRSREYRSDEHRSEQLVVKYCYPEGRGKAPDSLQRAIDRLQADIAGGPVTFDHLILLHALQLTLTIPEDQLPGGPREPRGPLATYKHRAHVREVLARTKAQADLLEQVFVQPGSQPPVNRRS